jgi:hypothetical protein
MGARFFIFDGIDKIYGIEGRRILDRRNMKDMKNEL